MSAGYNGGHKRQKEVILMAGFHDIIGHDDIIRHLKNAIETGRYPTLIFLQGNREPARSFLRGLLRQCCSVNRESLNRV